MYVDVRKKTRNWKSALSQIYKSIFKLTINHSNSHIVSQDERKQISCESPLAWRRLDAAWMQLCL